jgi:hypothetical protein
MVEMNETASILNKHIRSKFGTLMKVAEERVRMIVYQLLGLLPSFCMRHPKA